MRKVGIERGEVDPVWYDGVFCQLYGELDGSSELSQLKIMGLCTPSEDRQGASPSAIQFSASEGSGQ